MRKSDTHRSSGLDQLRRRSGLWLQIGALALTATPALAAKPRKPGDGSVNSISYFLPKVELELVGEFRVKRCAPDVEVTPTYTLVQSYLPDTGALVDLDTSVGFLAKRSVKIELYPDGTLKSFNGSWEGQGSKLITAVAKLALAVVTGPFKPMEQRTAQCNASTVKTLDDLAKKQAQIVAVEARLAKGQSQSSDLATRDFLLQQKAQLIRALTITKRWAIEVDAKASEPQALSAANGNPTVATEPQSISRTLEKVDYSALLIADTGLPGRNGTQVTLAASPGFKIADLASRQLSSPMTVSADLLYRRPVPGTLSIDPLVPGGKAPTDTFAILVPQWSAIHKLRLGKGGMFGSRSATAKFEANGMPSELSYGSTGASEGIAGLIDTAREGYGSLRDAELGQLKREIELAKARKELEDLRAASDE
ncbi:MULTISPECIES: hypothetical protein [unclassified Sphingomonas]|uniref:hypothetical protein n=1 Tax=unclassified Sphingomonas TaxID=196159 RepID=UPI002151140E|nr:MULTISPECIES: hypothetical protein [unclassified Sphingomonas]MCR5869469.1 hypothetical protein [Sphingomonas sp. J344]UUX98802.1 hypothetical protein LRS08_14950 [Sphingomonas sp. J315]